MLRVRETEHHLEFLDVNRLVCAVPRKYADEVSAALNKHLMDEAYLRWYGGKQDATG